MKKGRKRVLLRIGKRVVARLKAKERGEFLAFWLGCPNEGQFERFMCGKVLRPYQFWWMAKYPNGMPVLKDSRMSRKAPKRARKVGKRRKG